MLSLLSSSSIDYDFVFKFLRIFMLVACLLHLIWKKIVCFASKELISKSFYYIAIKNGFKFKTVRSNSKSIEFKCSQYNCPWYVPTSRYKGGELWRLRKYITNHDCSTSIIQTTRRQAFSSLISDCMIKKKTLVLLTVQLQMILWFSYILNLV